MRRKQSALPAIAGAFWDLRDHTYDHPEEWVEVTPETVFQVMAEILERAVDVGGEMDWRQFPGWVTAEALRRGPTAR